MIARYLQEQSSGSDVGSLLMGFLDFYGNHVRFSIAVVDPLRFVRDHILTLFRCSSTPDQQASACVTDSTLQDQFTSKGATQDMTRRYVVGH